MGGIPTFTVQVTCIMNWSLMANILRMIKTSRTVSSSGFSKTTQMEICNQSHSGDSLKRSWSHFHQATFLNLIKVLKSSIMTSQLGCLISNQISWIGTESRCTVGITTSHLCKYSPLKQILSIFSIYPVFFVATTISQNIDINMFRMPRALILFVLHCCVRNC